MKTLIYILIGLVLFVVATIAAAPFFISTDTLKDTMISQVREQTGRSLAISGKTNFSLFPQVGVEAQGVTLSNPPGFAGAQFAKMQEMQVRLDLVSLVTGTVAVKKFVLVKPVINLAVDSQGRSNWTFGDPKSSAARDDTGSGVGVSDIQIGRFDISSGTINYANAQTKTKAVVGDINLNLQMASFSDPLQAKGSLVWNGDKLNVDATLTTLAAVMTGQPAKIAGRITAPKLTTGVTGTITGGKAFALKGKLDLKTASVRALASWLGSPLAKGRGLGALNVAADVSSSGNQISLANAKITLDGMTVTGAATVRMADPRPYVKAAFSLDKLDLNQYLAAAAGKKAGSPGGWSKAPIDFSGLKAVDGDMSLKAGRIEYKKIRTGASQLNVQMRGGLVKADIPNLALYNGSANMTVSLDGQGATPSIAARARMANVDSLGLLGDAAGLDKIEGKANLDFNLTTRGASQHQMMSGLQGRANIKFLNGAIRGVDIAAILKAVQSGIQQGWKKGGKTPFGSLTANYVFKAGTGTNNDFKMLGPQVNITGAGTVTMPNQTLSYKVNPSLVGRGGITVLGYNVPIIISGPWANPKIYPDLPNILEDPAKAFKGLKTIGESGVDGIGGLIKKVTPPAGNPVGNTGKAIQKGVTDPLKKFKKLF